MKRVVVTGMGIISPIGNSVEAFWDSLKKKKIGIWEIQRFDASDYKVKLDAEVKEFDPLKVMGFKEAKRMELFSQYAVAAAAEAIKEAGLDIEKEDTSRIGVSVGCGIGSLQILEQAQKKTRGERSDKNPTASRSADDHKYGGRECCNSFWFERKMYKCRDSMCNRNSFHW